MAFQYRGEITGGLAPVMRVQAAANCYQGQLLKFDADAGGSVEPVTNAAAGPDATVIAGICLGQGRNTSPGTSLYNATYKGDLITYDSSSQANLLLNDPPGPAEVQLQVLTPNSLIWAPIVKDTIGTAPECKAAAAAVSNGLTFVVAAIDTTVAQYSTAYCRTGANRGQYRKITTATTTTQTVLVAYQNAIAAGDTFCIANLTMGLAHVNWDTLFQGIDSSYDPTTNYFVVIVHELNLEEAGKEYALFRLAPRHLG